MSRVYILGASMIAIVAGAGVAAAADLPRYRAPPPALVYTPAPAWSWTGPYVGLQGGYGWGGGTVTNNGWLGGAYAGYNFQPNTNWVFGLEGDFTFTGKSGSNGTVTVNNPWNSTFRGRVGYAVDKYLFYGTGGLAVGGLNSTGTPAESTTKVGWTAGLGVEAALTQRVTGRLEFRHTDLGTFPSTGSAYTSNDVLVGVGVKF